MIGLGFQEVVSYILTSPEVMGHGGPLDPQGLVTLENPVSRDYSCLRSWLTPILLAFLSHNRHVEFPHRVFECGDVVLPDLSKPTATHVERRLAAVICDRRVGYEDIQACLYALLRNLGLWSWSIEPLSHPFFIEGRTARLTVEGVEVALLGEVHPEVLTKFKLENPVAAFEASLSKLQSLLR